MVDIMPFCGFRPPVHLVNRIVELPYDVIDSEEAREMAKDNPYSFFHIAKSEIDVDKNIDQYDDRVYTKGAENLGHFFAKKWLIQESSSCFYVYAQQLGNHCQVGLVAGGSVFEYQNNIIKKHELTRIDKENDRVRHIDTLQANDEPVFFTYRCRASIDAIIAKVCIQPAMYDLTTSDQVRHTFWVVSDPKVVEQIRAEFQQVPVMYIADGHHRSAASSRVCDARKAKNPFHTGNENYNYFMTVIFPDNQMQIMPYNRVVKELNGLSFADFMAKIAEKFEMFETIIPAPAEKHSFGMYIQGKWYRLQAKASIVDDHDVIERLDVSILQKQVLDPILGIQDPRTNKRIKFVGGIKGTEALEKAVQKQGDGVAFAMYPVSIADLMEISDAGKIMPPKSTWFEPKLRSGFVVRSLR